MVLQSKTQEGEWWISRLRKIILSTTEVTGEDIVVRGTEAKEVEKVLKEILFEHLTWLVEVPGRCSVATIAVAINDRGLALRLARLGEHLGMWKYENAEEPDSAAITVPSLPSTYYSSR